MEYTLQLPELSRTVLEAMLAKVDREIPTSHSLAQGVVITAVEYNQRTSNGIDQGKVLYQDDTALFFQRTKRNSTTTEWAHLGLNDKYANTEKGRVLLTEIGNPIDQIEVIISHHARHLFAKAIARERHDYRPGQTRWQAATSGMHNHSRIKDYAVMLEWLEVFNQNYAIEKSDLRSITSSIGDIGMILERILPGGSWNNGESRMIVPFYDPRRELNQVSDIPADGFENKIILNYRKS